MKGSHREQDICLGGSPKGGPLSFWATCSLTWNDYPDHRGLTLCLGQALAERKLEEIQEPHHLCGDRLEETPFLGGLRTSIPNLGHQTCLGFGFQFLCPEAHMDWTHLEGACTFIMVLQHLPQSWEWGASGGPPHHRPGLMQFPTFPLLFFKDWASMSPPLGSQVSSRCPPLMCRLSFFTDPAFTSLTDSCPLLGWGSLKAGAWSLFNQHLWSTYCVHQGHAEVGKTDGVLPCLELIV